MMNINSLFSKTNVRIERRPSMQKKFLMTANEVMDEPGVSRAFAYRLMQKTNRELEEKGFTVINGKVSRKYFEEQFYGMAESRTNGG